MVNDHDLLPIDYKAQYYRERSKRIELEAELEHISKCNQLHYDELQHYKKGDLADYRKIQDSLPHVRGVVFEECKDCKGYRTIYDPKCSTCEGQGRVPVKCDYCRDGTVLHDVGAPCGSLMEGVCPKCDSLAYETRLVPVVPGMEVSYFNTHYPDGEKFIDKGDVVGVNYESQMLYVKHESGFINKIPIADCFADPASARLLTGGGG